MIKCFVERIWKAHLKYETTWNKASNSIIDNASFHKAKTLMEAFKKCNTLFKFIPPRGSDYIRMMNWIAEGWHRLDRATIPHSFVRCGIGSRQIGDYNSLLLNILQNKKFPPGDIIEEDTEDLTVNDSVIFQYKSRNK